MLLLSENRVNSCQIYGRFGFLQTVVVPGGCLQSL